MCKVDVQQEMGQICWPAYRRQPLASSLHNVQQRSDYQCRADMARCTAAAMHWITFQWTDEWSGVSISKVGIQWDVSLQENYTAMHCVVLHCCTDWCFIERWPPHCVALHRMGSAGLGLGLGRMKGDRNCDGRMCSNHSWVQSSLALLCTSLLNFGHLACQATPLPGSSLFCGKTRATELFLWSLTLHHCALHCQSVTIIPVWPLAWTLHWIVPRSESRCLTCLSLNSSLPTWTNNAELYSFASYHCTGKYNPTQNIPTW